MPQYTFGVDLSGGDVRRSAEHREYRWTDYLTAYDVLTYQSNQNALWELAERIRRGALEPLTP